MAGSEAPEVEAGCRARKEPALPGFAWQGIGPPPCSPATMPLEIKLRASHDLLSAAAEPGGGGREGAGRTHGPVDPDSPVLTDILLTLRQRPEEAGRRDLSCLPGQWQAAQKPAEAAVEMTKERSARVRRESCEQDEQNRSR